jgi:hypothetical protein
MSTRREQPTRQVRPDPQSVREFMAAYGRCYTPQAVRESLLELKSIIRLVEQADSEDGERACVDVLMRNAVPGTFAAPISAAIRELCNYPPEYREQMLDAAIAEAQPVAEGASALAKLMEQVGATIERLNPREKALLRVIDELASASCRLNPSEMDFPNFWPPIVRDAPLDVLRSDPSMAALVKAFDFAELVIEADP